MKNVAFLSDSFFSRCEQRGYREVELKADRPYFVLVAVIDGVTWGLPFRSSIRHPYVHWTNKAARCGIDYSKAVVIEDESDIDANRVPHIREEEFAFVKGHEREIAEGFKRYVKLYRKARKSMHPRYASLLRFSTLQNYEDVIGISEGTKTPQA